MVKFADTDLKKPEEMGQEDAVTLPRRSSDDNELMGLNSQAADSTAQKDGEGKKRKRKKDNKVNGHSSSRRRLSVSKPARDPRDEASPPRLFTETRSPSPVIDFDGLSRPSMPLQKNLEE